MWANAANQHVVAVKQQMVSSNGGGNIFIGLANKVHCFCGGDVFQHDLELREIGHDRR
ncbi:Uncharacterised protein [Vibrio cholerae]|uniref:Uncharacterized protein n=1 Tax=Vibrio cholerae TaxID=666 RepID=A0A655YXQ1_VIBCL|nr:Uncharacterised protein [Vibrio cholerae]